MKTNLNQSFSVVAGAVILVSLPFSVRASSLYDLDAGTSTSPVYTGAAVLGSSGDLWSSYNAGQNNTTVALENSTGSTAAGVTVNISETSNIAAYDDPGGTAANPLALMEDYLFGNTAGANNGPIEVRLAGLPDLMAFTLVVYAAGDGSGQGSTINLMNNSSFTSVAQTASTTGANRNISSGQGVNYVEFTGTTSATGTVDFEVVQETSQYFELNGFQLSVVPEPSSMALAGLGLLALGAMAVREHRRRGNLAAKD